MTKPTLTIDLDSITVILEPEEIATLGYGACRRVANAMADVADAAGIDVLVDHERVSGKRRGEDHRLWESLAIDRADAIRARLGFSRK
jgi:hypothetical protein